MLKKVLQTIRDNELFCPGSTLVVAVSGGPDSVALLDILASLPELRLCLVVAHLNHLLRNDESDGDEEFVRALAVKYDLQLAVKRVDVKEFSRQRKLSLEEAGRICRYAFFAEVAAEYGANAVALAHHADDQAETVLLRLLRGSAGSGLCGMLPKSEDGFLVRPMLGVTRVEVERYLSDRSLPYRIDSSNSDTSFLRNRIRHELLPTLADYNPAISERLSATAEALAADEALLQHLVAGLFEQHAVHDRDRIVLGCDGIRNEPRGARLRLYRLAIQKVKGDLRAISFRHLGDIDRLVCSAKPHMELVLPGGTIIRKSYDSLAFSKLKDDDAPVAYELFVDGPGSYPLPGGLLLVVDTAEKPTDVSHATANCARFDLAAAPFPWLVRTFRDGDRITPFGMTGRKKVKDLFIDEKVPLDQRRRIPLLFCGERLLWVCGVRRAAAARINEGTTIVATAVIEGFDALNGL